MAQLADMLNWIVDLSEGEHWQRRGFSLSPSVDPAARGADGKVASGPSAGRAAPGSPGSSRAPSSKAGSVPPQSVLERRAMQDPAGGRVTSPDTCEEGSVRQHTLPRDLKRQVRYLRKLLHAPRNTDITFSQHMTRGGQLFVAIYAASFVNTADLEAYLLKPLRATSDTPQSCEEWALRLPCVDPEIETHVARLAEAVIEGKTVLLGGFEQALLYTFFDPPARSVATPINETVLRGSQEAFTEDLSATMAQLRRYVRSPKLIMEMTTLRDPARTRLAVCSFSGLTNLDLLAEVHRRIDNIGELPISASGLIEQHLEDHWRSLFPTILYTERPDMASRYLTEGHVLVLIDNLPIVLVAPATFWMQFTTAEDRNLRVWYANFLRLIRLLAMVNSLMLPALYISLTNFQQEMIPSDILLTMTASRQNLPFPTIVEVLLLEVAFELIREASIRVPHVIGSTIGIVGALILGQSAVEANLVSPLVVIIVAITGLGSFAIPNQSIGYAFRILRYIFTMSAFLFGFFGIATLFSVLVVYLTGLKSFGIPYLTPIAPFRRREEGFFRKSVLGYRAIPQSVRPRAGSDPDTLQDDSFETQSQVLFSGLMGPSAAQSPAEKEAKP
ncbi:MAG: spore germination protein [Firmicutes bacterium]|nr:spore germination protein [Bacillota bacterium]